MRSNLIVLLCSFFLFTGSLVYGQSDTSGTFPSADSVALVQHPESSADDEEFNLFLLALLVVAMSAMIGAAIIGAFAAAIFLFITIGFIGAGILSVSVLAALYKRSVTAGFRTFLYIVCPLAGMIMGITGYLIVSNLFKISISNNTGILAGATGGILGGILMAFAISKISISILNYFWGKFNRTDRDSQK